MGQDERAAFARSERLSLLSTPSGLLCILLLALGLRAIAALQYWVQFDSTYPWVWHDSQSVFSLNSNHYLYQAKTVASNNEGLTTWRQQAFFRPPLASWYFDTLLRAVNFDRWLASLLQSTVAVLGYLLLYLTARLWLSRPLARVALVLVACHPVLIHSDMLLEDTPLTRSTLALMLWLLLRGKAGWRHISKRVSPSLGVATRSWLPLFAAGLAAALLTLSRSNLVLAAVVAPILLIERRQCLAALGRLWPYSLPLLIALAACSWHNGHSGGSWSPFTQTSGMTLFWGNGGRDYYLTDLEEGTPIPLLAADNPTMTLIDQVSRRYPALDFDGAMAAAAGDAVRANPGHFFRRLLERLGWHLTHYEIPRDDDFDLVHASQPLLALPYLPYSLCFALMVVGVLASRRPRRLALLVWLVPIANILVTELIFCNAGRYRALTWPLVIWLAMLGLQVIWRQRRTLINRQSRCLGLLLWLSLCLAVGQWGLSEERFAAYRATDQYKRARLLLSNRDACQATDQLPVSAPIKPAFETALSRALALSPNHLPAFYMASLYQIYNLQTPTATVAAQIDARAVACGDGDWLCHTMIDKLKRIVQSPETYQSTVRRLTALGRIGCRS